MDEKDKILQELNKLEDEVQEEPTQKGEKNTEHSKKIEIVTGDGQLDISPVYEHLEVEKPKPKENKKIFIPEVKNNSSHSNNENTSEN